MDAKHTANAARSPGRWGAALALAACAGGCASLQPVAAVPASRVPPALLGERRDYRERIDLMRLRQDPPDVHLLAPRDILALYAEGITDSRDGVPQVNFPESGNLPPSIGYPVAVREDGTAACPKIRPIKVEGLTIAEAEELIGREYQRSGQVAKAKDSKITVTLLRPRTVQVLVVREDSGAQQAQPDQLYAQGRTNARGPQPVTRRGGGFTIDLRAYENDVLHALNQTGGLPGDDAKNEIVILRGGWHDATERDRQHAALAAQREAQGLPPRKKGANRWSGNPNVTRIALRYDPKHPPRFDEDDIILRENDVVVVEARDQDFFSTGGLLPGGQIPLPRDRDLDVLGAIALAGGSLGGGFGSGRAGGSGFGASGLGGLIAPTEAVIVRETDCGNVTMKVNLAKALTDPAQRVLIQPGDLVMLRYTTGETIANLFFSTVNFSFLFNGLSRAF